MASPRSRDLDWELADLSDNDFDELQDLKVAEGAAIARKPSFARTSKEVSSGRRMVENSFALHATLKCPSKRA